MQFLIHCYRERKLDLRIRFISFNRGTGRRSTSSTYVLDR